MSKPNSRAKHPPGGGGTPQHPPGSGGTSQHPPGGGGTPRRTFTEPWELSDVELVVEGPLVHANKAVLAMWSPVLRAMFYGAFRERAASTVCLPGKRFDEILELVRVLHPPNREIDGGSYFYTFVNCV